MTQEVTDYKTAFKAFEKRFLKEKKSIFNLADDNQVLTKESIEYLIKNFVENGDDSKDSFLEKLKKQFDGSEEEDDEIKKKAIEVMATAVWLWRLAPLNTTQNARKNSVQEVLDLGDLNISSDDFFDSKIKGFAAPGMFYYTNKPFELAYIIRFFEKCLKSDATIELLKVGKVSIATKKGVPTEKSVAIHNSLLYLFNPKEYVPALSFGHKKRIVSAFSDFQEIADIDEQLKEIIKTLREKNGKFDTADFYKSEYREQWDPTVLPAKNVIYYGAPGTGKTYQVTELVKNKTNGNGQYQIQQFHPSFSYEDFIDGVKPDCIGDDGMKFKLVNGAFKKICIKAFEELVHCKENKTEPEQFYFIADEINRAELSRVFGELLLCLEEDKRLRFEGDKLVGMMIKTQNSSLWQKEHAVVVIDKDGKVTDEDNKEGYYFGVPENIYFLGTMNDIDRSIDSFDLALRRRFTWVHKACDYDVIANALMEKDANDEATIEYVGNGKDVIKGRCLLLNEYISKTLNLGSSYELGHSYYMKIDVRNGEISKAAYERLFDYELSPLLAEYLRAEYASGRDLEGKLREMRGLFIEGKSKR